VIAETPEIPETPAAANGDVKEDDK